LGAAPGSQPNERLQELVRAQSQTAAIIGESKAMTDVPLSARCANVTRKDERQFAAPRPNDITRRLDLGGGHFSFLRHPRILRLLAGLPLPCPLDGFGLRAPASEFERSQQKPLGIRHEHTARNSANARDSKHTLSPITLQRL
jgi:hypothetical protein